MQAAAKHRWALIALDLQVDTSTANGEAMAYVVAVFANLERRLIGERTKAGLAEARRRGARLGRPRLLPDDVVRRILVEREGGAALQAIADRLTAEGVAGAQGGRRWYPSTVAAVLKSADPSGPHRDDSGRGLTKCSQPIATTCSASYQLCARTSSRSCHQIRHTVEAGKPRWISDAGSTRSAIEYAPEAQRRGRDW